MKRLLFLLCLGVTSTVAQERILDFQSTIVVNLDRSVDVTEIIKVRAEGVDIKRGIYRDIITTMKNDRGKKQRLTLTVHEVLKNGKSENFVTESSGINTRIKIGDADVLLESGEYTYTINYNLTRQVRFFDNYDEIYWNVTGNEWMFSIERASAIVILPEDAIISQHAAYSGQSGATGCLCEFSPIGNNSLRYEVSSSLNPYEGLTVAVGWQKGVVPSPTQAELDEENFNDHRGIYYGAFCLLIMFGYLMFAWFRVGRDPAKGAIIPRFIPPDGFSPAACRYVLRMGFDTKAFAASIVSMAVKGFLVIDQSTKHYVLKKNSNDDLKLTSGERKIAENIFQGTESITLSRSYNSSVQEAVAGLEKNLETEFRKINFFKNSGWMIPSILFGVAIIGYIFYEASFDEPVFVALIIIMFFLLFTIIPATASFMTARKSTGCLKYFRMFFSIAMIAAVVGVPAFLQIKFNLFGSDWVGGLMPYLMIISSVVFLNVLFFYLMQAPTVFGRKRMDEIEGLKMFMEVAEKDRLNMLNPPDKTPQLFEQLLPYAIALDVENAWGKQFDDILKRAIENNEYNPSWYTGRSTFNAYTLSHSLGSSFSSTLESSSTPPSSSSSGSGGGGSSGGGGGGGGGGGW